MVSHPFHDEAVEWMGHGGLQQIRKDLIEQDTLIGKIEGEGGDLDIEAIAAVSFHLVGAAHHAGWGVERHATRIFIALAGLEDGLLADDAGPLDLSEFAARIGDHPVAAE